MEAGVKSKGYSIWSLMVIMTLLAVWLAVPRRWEFERRYLELFIVFHQLMLWLLVGSLIWNVTGRKRIAGHPAEAQRLQQGRLATNEPPQAEPAVHSGDPLPGPM